MESSGGDNLYLKGKSYKRKDGINQTIIILAMSPTKDDVRLDVMYFCKVLNWQGTTYTILSEKELDILYLKEAVAEFSLGDLLEVTQPCGFRVGAQLLITGITESGDIVIDGVAAMPVETVRECFKKI